MPLGDYMGGLFGGVAGNVVGRAVVQIVGDTTMLKKAFIEAEASANAASQSVGATASRSAAIAEGAFVAARLALVAFAAKGVESAIKFNYEMSKVVSLVGVSTAEMERLKGSVLSLASVSGRAPIDLARGLYFVESGGFRGAAALEILDKAAKSATIGLGDTRSVAFALVSAMNAYAGSGLTVTAATDQMIAAVREGHLQADQLAGSLGQVLPIAAQVGVTFGEVAGSIAAASRVGLPVSRAATGIRYMLAALINPASQAARSIEHVFGSVEALRQNLQKEGLVDTLKKLHDQLRPQEFDSAVGGVRSLIVALTLVGQNARQAEEVVNKVTHAAGSFARAWGVAQKQVAVQLRQLRSAFEVDLIKAGDAVMPVVRLLLGGLKLLAPVIEVVADNFGVLLGVMAGFRIVVGLPAVMMAIGRSLQFLVGTGAAEFFTNLANATAHWLGGSAAAAQAARLQAIAKAQDAEATNAEAGAVERDAAMLDLEAGALEANTAATLRNAAARKVTFGSTTGTMQMGAGGGAMFVPDILSGAARARAPSGGLTIGKTFYKGGQFLPAAETAGAVIGIEQLTAASARGAGMVGSLTSSVFGLGGMLGRLTSPVGLAITALGGLYLAWKAGQERAAAYRAEVDKLTGALLSGQTAAGSAYVRGATSGLDPRQLAQARYQVAHAPPPGSVLGGRLSPDQGQTDRFGIAPPTEDVSHAVDAYKQVAEATKKARAETAQFVQLQFRSSAAYVNLRPQISSYINQIDAMGGASLEQKGALASTMNQLLTFGFALTRDQKAEYDHAVAAKNAAGAQRILQDALNDNTEALVKHQEAQFKNSGGLKDALQTAANYATVTGQSTKTFMDSARAAYGTFAATIGNPKAPVAATHAWDTFRAKTVADFKKWQAAMVVSFDGAKTAIDTIVQSSGSAFLELHNGLTHTSADMATLSKTAQVSGTQILTAVEAQIKIQRTYGDLWNKLVSDGAPTALMDQFAQLGLQSVPAMQALVNMSKTAREKLFKDLGISTSQAKGLSNMVSTTLVGSLNDLNTTLERLATLFEIELGLNTDAAYDHLNTFLAFLKDHGLAMDPLSGALHGGGHPGPGRGGIKGGGRGSGGRGGGVGPGGDVAHAGMTVPGGYGSETPIMALGGEGIVRLEAMARPGVRGLVENLNRYHSGGIVRGKSTPGDVAGGLIQLGAGLAASQILGLLGIDGKLTHPGWHPLGGGGGAGGGIGATTHNANVSLGQAVARGMGWGGSQFNALNMLWTRESGWNQYARNPSSGAYGIPQALPPSKMGPAANPPYSSAAAQINWGVGYIRGRYGTPASAWAHSQDVGWYHRGGVVPRDMLAMLKGSEIVTNPADENSMRPLAAAIGREVEKAIKRAMSGPGHVYLDGRKVGEVMSRREQLMGARD